MSSPGFADSLDLRPRPSGRLHRMLLLAHGLALGVLPFAMARGWVTLVFAAAFGLSWWWSARHPAFGAGPRALVRMLWHADGHWTVWTRGGTRLDAHLRDDSIVAGPLLILRFKADEGATTWTRALAGDEFDADAWRRLRARLRIRQGL